MMDAQEAIDAVSNLDYGMHGSPEREFYQSEQTRITREFMEHLADEYAFNLPASTHSLIWNKAWEDGHHAGFSLVEIYYAEIVEFTESLFKAKNAE